MVEISAAVCKKQGLPGYRQKKHNIKKLRKISINISKCKRGRPKKESTKQEKEKNLRQSYRDMIRESQKMINQAEDIIKCYSIEDKKLHSNILEFKNYANILIDQIERRVFFGETIPHEEKIFSIFEPHTEWISKGKAKAPVELGKRVTVVEDQYRFLLHHRVMDRETDDKVAFEVIENTKKIFPNLSSCSFDKGFYSKENIEKLSEMLDSVAMPKKGKLSAKDKERESSEEFIEARKRHPAVESAINALEVHGLDRCLDFGIKGFERYVALAITSRNIQRIGALVRAKQLRIKQLHKQKNSQGPPQMKQAA